MRYKPVAFAVDYNTNAAEEFISQRKIISNYLKMNKLSQRSPRILFQHYKRTRFSASREQNDFVLASTA